MSKHTPGPWHYGLKSEKTWNVGVYAPDGSEVAHIAVRSAFVSHRRDADARLIAAAPDLLESLKDAYPHITDDVLRARAGAAIAKAEGV